MLNLSRSRDTKARRVFWCLMCWNLLEIISEKNQDRCLDISGVKLMLIDIWIVHSSTSWTTSHLEKQPVHWGQFQWRSRQSLLMYVLHHFESTGWRLLLLFFFFYLLLASSLSMILQNLPTFTTTRQITRLSLYIYHFFQFANETSAVLPLVQVTHSASSDHLAPGQLPTPRAGSIPRNLSRSQPRPDLM